MLEYAIDDKTWWIYFFFLSFFVQIQKLEKEIQEKKRQMQVLEQRIIESGEASIANASIVDMQQVFNCHFHLPLLYIV